jgi:hypothetical protein
MVIVLDFALEFACLATNLKVQETKTIPVMGGNSQDTTCLLRPTRPEPFSTIYPIPSTSGKSLPVIYV